MSNRSKKGNNVLEMDKYEEFCHEFSNSKAPHLTSLDNQEYLVPYFDVFKEIFDDYVTGVFAIDRLGIYTPVQGTSNGVVFFRKYPFTRQRVFSAHEGYNCIYMKWQSFFVIFVNVINVGGGKYNFMGKVGIQPITSINVECQAYYFIPKSNSPNGTLEGGGNDENDDDYYDEENSYEYLKKLRENLTKNSDSDSD